MFELFFFGKFDIHMYSIIEDLFVIIMLYSYIKLILLSSLVELIWPTQLFNRRNSSNVISFRLRTFVEVLTKLRVITFAFSMIPLIYIIY